MRQFANLAKKAVGFSVDRGDQLEISCAPLALKAPEGVVATSSLGGWQESLFPTLKIGLLILAVLLAFMFFLKRKPLRTRPTLLEGPPTSILPPRPKPKAALSEEMDRASALAGGDPQVALPDAVAGQELIGQLITSYPERTIEVLRLWLNDKESR